MEGLQTEMVDLMWLIEPEGQFLNWLGRMVERWKEALEAEDQL